MTDHQGPPATRFGQNGGICHKQQARGPRNRSRASCGGPMRVTRCSRVVPRARANAGAVPYGIAAGAVGALPGPANQGYGIDANHWVVYLASDVPARSLTAWWLGAPLPAGGPL